MTSSPTSRTRRVRVVASALVGAVLALGATAGSASAYEPKLTETVVQVGKLQSEPFDGSEPMSLRSGIRW